MTSDTISKLQPIFSIENDFLISKNGDISVAYKLTLPKVYTLKQADIKRINQLFNSIICSLPEDSIIQKQDYFFTNDHDGPEDVSLQYSNALFYEKPLLSQTCYLIVTKESKDKIGLSGTKEGYERYIENVKAFVEQVQNCIAKLENSGYFSLKKLNDEALIAVLGQYFSLSIEPQSTIQDISFDKGLKVRDNFAEMYAITSNDQINNAYKTLKSNRASVEDSFTIPFIQPLCLGLECNHIYNQVIFISGQDKLVAKLKAFERTPMAAMDKTFDHTTSIEDLIGFVDEDENDLKIIELHLNIIVWAKDEDKLRHHKLQLEKNFKMLNIIPYQIKRDIQNNFIYNSPGATGYLAEAYRFINTSTHSPVFLNMESYNKGNKEGILLNDKGTGKTIRLDLWKAPLDRGLIKNRNRLILGAKEKGEAILINHILAQYNEQRHHIMMIDIDDSYQKICEESHGNHYCYDLEKPIPFNPFYCEDLENVPLEKKKVIRILINLIWEEKKSTSASDNDQLDQYITKYYDHIVLNDTIKPSLSSFYEYMSTLDDSKSTAPNFDRQSLLASIKPFYEGEYKNIFCTEAPYGVSNNSFAVFSLRSIKDNATLLPLITLLCIADFYDKAPENPSIKKSLFINECWKSLSNSQKPDTIKLLYNRPPKANTELVVMTKALKDIISDPMGKFIIDQTETLVFMKQKIQSSLKQDLARHLSFTESEVKKLFSIDDREVYIKVGGLSNIYVIEEILCRQSRFKIPINIANNYF